MSKSLIEAFKFLSCRFFCLFLAAKLQAVLVWDDDSAMKKNPCLLSVKTDSGSVNIGDDWLYGKEL